ncbi:hypothetical protein OGAPHI_000128 [Ogataea philodendri]|uniref:Uncharacterized protein n=1 Tax=Ogataea philodendri TaxID=1378263 RepID=A0A9P8PH28_9ASCO|nr:uncharacterized protein OGAPHI_000128 [Ogataea philodendri]KAH3671942.1 hypothetical protein OGAPHI_000128 [Ogataea philodendri]
MESSDYENISMSIYSQVDEGANQPSKTPLKDLGNLTDQLSSDKVKRAPVTSAGEYRKLERLYGDSVIRINELVRHLERAETEVMTKEQQLDIHAQRIHELVMENKTISNELKHEREINDKEYHNWNQTRQTMEQKIDSLSQMLHNLLQNNKSLEQIQTDSISLHENDLSRYKKEVDQLTKKITILEKENELEAHSKILIIEELETFRLRFDELEDRYEKLKEEYAELMSELSMNSTSDIRLEDQAEFPEDEVKFSLADELKDFGEVKVSGSRKSSQRHSSFNNLLNNIERDSVERRHTQEITKMGFQVKSLELQNEKLHSYIGFLLQHIPQEEANGIAIYKDQLDYQYSDEINILSAKKTLKKVIRSASALPIRPQTYRPAHYDIDESEDNFGRHNSFSDINVNKNRLSYNTNTSLSDQDNIFDSANQVEDIEYVELGDSDFTMSDEEIEEEEDNNDESLNVSFTVDLTPSLNIKKRKKSKLFKRTPRKQLEKLTIFGSPSAKEPPLIVTGRASMKSLRKYASSLELIGEESEAAPKEDYNELLHNCHRGIDELDEGDIEVTKEELDLFRIDFKKLKCLKHFTFQCGCQDEHSSLLVLRRLFEIFGWPSGEQAVLETDVFEVD